MTLCIKNQNLAGCGAESDQKGEDGCGQSSRTTGGPSIDRPTGGVIDNTDYILIVLFTG
jgi:hypothetical protein